MSKRVIDAILRLTDNFTNPLQKSVTAMTNCSKSAVKIGRDIDKVGQTISGIGMAATAAVTMPLVGMGIASTKSFGDVDKNLRLIQQTMGSTDEEAEMLEAAIKKAAEGSVFGMSDATEATLNYARAGFDASETAALIEPALSLAAGTATDLSLATTGLGGVMKAFQLDMSQSSHVADVFSRAQAQANITATDLIETIGIGAPMFKTVGWSFEDMATAADLFGDAVIPVNEGMTAMKTGLMRLANPKETGIEAVDRATQALFDETGQMKSFVETQSLLHDAFAGLSQHQKLLAADTLFGKNQAAKWIALIDSAPETVNRYRDALDDCTGSAKSMADALMSGTGGALESLGSAFDVMKYNVGKALGSTITPFIQALTKLIVKFNDMDPAQQKQIVRWGMIASAIGPVFVIFGKLVSMGGRLVIAFNKAGLAVKAAGSLMGLIASPAGVVIAVVAGIAAVIALVVTHIDQFKAAFGKVSVECAPAVKDLTETFREFYATVQPVISMIINLVTGALVAAFENAGFGISIVCNAISMIVSGIAEVIHGVVEFFAGIVSGDWSRACNGFCEAVTGVVDIITGKLEGIIGVISTIVGAVSGAVGSVMGFVDKAKGGTGGNDEPSHGGKGRTFGHNALGTTNWRGGLTYINERGGEIIDLPRGTRIYPHDESLTMARQEGLNASSGAPSVLISGNTFNVRSEADIEQIGNTIVRKLQNARNNRGDWTFNGAMA